MLRRDFIMVQIEELGKVIARIISERNTDAARQAPALIEGIYRSLKIDPDYLLTASAKDIRSVLNDQDGEGLRRMEIAVKAMIEESYISPERAGLLLIKAKDLLEYIQLNDHTFSLERVSLLEDINSRLNFTS